ncbi:hypothetical protein AB2L27_06940 [Kineococcus sp. LSe6-4]|uniref:Uncharacterized protein n=1 Tax=Kineococcus halophytocola TaxID=3234027 RepID=A0ABV4H0Z2_9ACTN
MQLCHFHLPHRDAGYLGGLGAALAEAGVELDALLVDDGDLTHPDEGPRHEASISNRVADAADVTAILDPLDGAVGLLVALGNWTGPGKYADLAAVTRFAETCHAKVHRNGPDVDAQGYRRNVSTVLEHGHTGPFCLVCDATDDEWAGLEVQRAIVRELPA